MSTLTQLRYLRLEAMSVEAATTGLPFLPLLSRLEQLHLRGCYPLPCCMSQLTQLQALSLTDDGGWYWEIEEEQGAEVTGAVALAELPELNRLTFLALSEMPGMTSLPPSVAALAELRVLYWDGGTNADGDFLDPASAALPRGAWLDRLQTLATYPNVLLGTLPLLGAAAQLQCLGVLNWYSIGMDDVAAAVRCAASRPGLRRLLVEVDAAKLADLAAFKGQQLPPGLRIESHRHQQICSFLMEECGASL